MSEYQGPAGEESGNGGGQILAIRNAKGRDWYSMGRFQQDIWGAASETDPRQWVRGPGEARAEMASGGRGKRKGYV